MSRALRRAALAAVALLAAGGVLGYVRTRSPKGVCLWWASRQVPYAVNDFTVNAAVQVCGAPASTAVQSSVQASFTTWTQATLGGAASPCTDLRLVSRGTTPSTNTGLDGVNLVVFRRGLCSDGAIVPAGDPCFAAGTCADGFNCWDTSEPQHAAEDIVALTTASYDTRTGEILDADMELNAWMGSGPSPPGYYFTCVNPVAPPCILPGQANCISMDVQNTVTHEAGHFLGLDHTSVAGATMAATASIGETAKRSLEPDDVQGICAIYPAGAPATTCGTVSKGGCGCGAGGAGEWLGLAALLLLRRRWRCQVGVG